LADRRKGSEACQQAVRAGAVTGRRQSGIPAPGIGGPGRTAPADQSLLPHASSPPVLVSRKIGSKQQLTLIEAALRHEDLDKDKARHIRHHESSGQPASTGRCP
jgi:hypothetical protein